MDASDRLDWTVTDDGDTTDQELETPQLTYSLLDRLLGSQADPEPLCTPSASTPADISRTTGELMRRRRRLAYLQRQLDKTVEELAALERYPAKDPLVDGEAIAFARAADDGRTYTYVALRINGRYYLTGGNSRTPQGTYWGALIEWMGDQVAPGGVIRLVPGDTLL